MKIKDLLCGNVLIPQEPLNTIQETILESVYPSPSNTPDIEVKKFPCPFDNCSKSFTRKYNLSAHLRCHNQEKPFECTNCPMKFARKHDLQRHIRSLHEHKKQYGPCDYCNAYFTRSDALSRHLRIEKEKRK
jgi:uncharacterized Zn-finger protein